MTRDERYHIAQVCLNGHTINTVLDSTKESDKQFCDQCGATTITACQSCGVGIRGRYRTSMDVRPYVPPKYCHGCGKPHPWTQATLEAARELADELDDLSVEERGILKGTLDDLVADTPRTALAATRFKKLVAKAGPAVADGFKQILIDVVSESAEKRFGARCWQGTPRPCAVQRNYNSPGARGEEFPAPRDKTQGPRRKKRRADDYWEPESLAVSRDRTLPLARTSASRNPSLPGKAKRPALWSPFQPR